MWAALPRAIAAAFGGRRGPSFARVLACRYDGDPARFAPVAGATLPGFRVARVEPDRLLELEGEHRFARYALTFRVDPRAEGATIRAETRAAFPGLKGRLYRALVVGTGGHRIVTRRILRGIARRAERSYK